MRKSFVSLGLLASANALPAFAHEMPVVMAHNPAFFASPSVNGHVFQPVRPSGFATSGGPGKAGGWDSSSGTIKAAARSALFGSTNTPASTAARAITGAVSTGAAGGGQAQAINLSANLSLNLDLSSTSANMTAGSFLHNGTVSIDVGGTALAVTAKTELTPAEYMAVMQVASGQKQSLILDSLGSASGGSIVINQQLNKEIANLVIPQGVTVVDLARTGTINLAGNVTDGGNLYLSSLNPSLSTINLDASKITVQGQGLISDALPFAGLLLSGSADTNLNLNLNAGNSFANAGTISSAGRLSIISGGSITNAPGQGQTASTPVIQAAGDINIVSGAGAVTNAGLISSAHGSINLATISQATDLSVSAAGGTFQAASGNINMRQAGYDGSANLNLNGGNYFSQNLNLNSGTGTVTGSLGQVSGQLNTIAQVAHISADTPALVLGSQKISGDPTYANTGDIDIAGAVTITGGDNLAIVAGGNILSTSSSAAITDNGGNVLLIAGANIISGGGSGGAGLSGSNPSGAATGLVTVSMTGGKGGNIDFAGLTAGSTTSNAATAIDTSSVTAAGGSVTLVALTGTNALGNVYFNNAAGTGTINTTGGAASSSGNLAIFAGASPGTSIQTSTIITGGSLAKTGGDVLLSASQATTSDGANLVIDAGGNIASVNTIVAGSAYTSSAISLGSINTAVTSGSATNGGAIAVSTLGSVRASGDFTSSGADSTQSGNTGGNAGSITIAAGQGAILRNLIANGGAGCPGGGFGFPGSGGNAGAIVITTATGGVNVQSVSAIGGSGGSGGLGFGGNGGAGGLVAIMASTGNVSISGPVTSAGGAGGNSGLGDGAGGSAGNIIINSGLAISVSGASPINASGGSSGTGIGALSGGNGGAITFTAGTSIQTDGGSSISSVGGQSSPFQTGGNGGPVTFTAGSGNITVGNIASDSGTGLVSTGGNVIIAALGGSVTAGNTTLPSTTAAISASGSTQAGGVTISATGTISLVSVDSNNIVINTSSTAGNGASVLLGSALVSGPAISLDGGNIVSAGAATFFTGNAWVLSLTGTTHGPYTVNGNSSNPNDFKSLSTQSITGSSGTTTITFASGSAPTNFSPGGYSSINTSGTQQTVLNTGVDATLIVPIVATNALGSGTFNIAGTASLQEKATNQAALMGNQGIAVNGALTTNSGNFALAALVDTSSSGITVISSPNIVVGSAAANGPLNLTVSGGNSLTVTNAIAATDVTLTAASVSFGAARSAAGIIAGSGSIAVQSPSSMAISGSASFASAAGDTVSFLASSGGNTITLADSTSLDSTTANLILQSNTINFGSFTSIGALAPGGNITIEAPVGGNLTVSGNTTLTTTASGTTSLLAESTTSSTLTVSDATGITIAGGGQVDIFTPNLVFNATTATPTISASDASLIVINGGTAAAVVPMTITGPAGFQGAISTNGGVIFIRPTGDLEFEDSGAQPALISFSAGSGIIDIQAAANVTIDPQVTLLANSPIQINLNADQTLALNGNARLTSTVFGNASFPDPLGGDLQYSILVQNLISNFNLAGTGIITQVGTGFTVFNDFTNIGLADGTNLTFGSNTGFGTVNFFTRQIQVNGTALDSTPTAALTFTSGITNVNFNTNLPSVAPGDFAFVPGTMATSATLNITGVPINVGFQGATPPFSIPSLQQPVGNINIGMPGGGFALSDDQSIATYSNIVTTIFALSTVSSSAGVLLDASSSTAGSVVVGGTVSAFGTLTINSGALGSLTVLGSGIAQATNVAIATSTVTNNGTIRSTIAGGAFISVTNTAGGVLLTGTGSWSAPSKFIVSAQGNLNVGQLFTGGQLLSTNFLSLTANNGVLTLPVNVLTAATDSSGDGGTISLTASSLVLGSGTQPLSLQAGATGAGQGGVISVILTGAAPVTIGSGGGNLNISAVGGSTSGDGGNVTVQVGGNLVINPGQVVAGPSGSSGKGAIYDFIAGTSPGGGTLVVKGNLSADGVGTGSDGGKITLQANSKTAFSVDSAKATNGTQGTLSVNGVGAGSTDGIINITSLGSGGIIELQPLTAVSQVNLATSNGGALTGANGSITISATLGGANTSLISLGATGSGKISEGTKDAIAAATINASSGAGAITLADISAPATGTTITANTGSKGAVTITNVSMGTLNINGAQGGSAIFKSLGDISTSGSIFAGSVALATTAKTGGTITIGGFVQTSSGSITLTTPGDIVVSAGASMFTSKAVTLTASGTASTVSIDGEINGQATGTVTVLVAASIAPNAIDSGATGDISAGKSVSLTATKSSVVVNTIGASVLTGVVSITALTNIQNNDVINALTSVSEKTTATSGASAITVAGNITASGTGGIVTLTNSGGAGASGGIDATANITATKAITIAASKGDITLASVTAGNTVKATAFDQILANGPITGTTGVTLATTSTTGTNQGSITVGSISTGSVGSTVAGGPITVTAAGGALTVNPLAVISANSGTGGKATVTLQNNLITGKGGTIVVGGGAQITTAGAAGGSVNIVMGAVPGGAKGNILPIIPGVNFNPNNPQSVIFVGAKQPNSGINFVTTGVTNPINVSVVGKGVKVVLNTGSLADTAITINGGSLGQPTTITADPPVTTAAQLTATTAQAKGDLLGIQMPGLSPQSGDTVPQLSGLPLQVQQQQTQPLQLSAGQFNQAGSLQGSIANINLVNLATTSAGPHTLYGGATIYGEGTDREKDFGQLPGWQDIDAILIDGAELGGGAPALKAGAELPNTSSKVGRDSKVRVLHKGNALVAPAEDTVIETAFGKVEVSAHSMALIMALPTGTAVYNLDDRHKDSIVVTLGTSRIALAPGRHVMITSQLDQGFEMVNPAQFFVFRNLAKRHIDSDLQAFTSEFYVPSALLHVRQLRTMVTSKNTHVREIAAHVLKTAAIVSQMGGGGNYQQYQQPHFTASSLVK